LIPALRFGIQVKSIVLEEGKGQFMNRSGKGECRLAYLCLQATREGQASHAHVHEIIAGLQKRGWEVQLFEPAYAQSGEIPPPHKRLGEFLRTQARLQREARHVDAVYIRAHPFAYLTARWTARRHLLTVQEINGPYQDVLIAFPWLRRVFPLFRWSMRRAYQMADALITVTEELKEWVVREGVKKPVYVVPNGANTELFHPHASLFRPLPKPYVLFFGALASWQGIDTILGAIHLPEWEPGLSLVVAGDGVKRQAVESLAASDPRILYLGRVPYKEMPGIIAGSLAGLSPQNNEANRSHTGLFPLKVFETLACGAPVIVTDFPGMADLVRGEQCGIIIPPGDAQALAQAAAHLMRNPQEREAMGKRGRSAIVQFHSWDKRAADTHEVLMKLVEGRQK
jgi:glycosyltransferase involved in cell wall biosynthesis